MPIHFIIILIDIFILICFLFKEFLGDDQGNITGIRTVKVDWVKVRIIITLPGAVLGLFQGGFSGGSHFQGCWAFFRVFKY